MWRGSRPGWVSWWWSDKLLWPSNTKYARRVQSTGNLFNFFRCQLAPLFANTTLFWQKIIRAASGPISVGFLSRLQCLHCLFSCLDSISFLRKQTARCLPRGLGQSVLIRPFYQLPSKGKCPRFLVWNSRRQRTFETPASPLSCYGPIIHSRRLL